MRAFVVFSTPVAWHRRSKMRLRFILRPCVHARSEKVRTLNIISAWHLFRALNLFERDGETLAMLGFGLWFIGATYVASAGAPKRDFSACCFVDFGLEARIVCRNEAEKGEGNTKG